MKANRRDFLKKTSLTILGFSLFNFKANAHPFLIAACETTTKDYYGIGPFYRQNAPEVVNNILAATTEVGERLIIEGYVRDLNCDKLLPNTLIEIWHANNAGQYDNSGFNLRGKVYSGANGYYFFETILPGKYLNGNTYRPSHIHFKISPPETEPFITQLYFEGDSDISNDAAASINSGEFDATHRIINLNQDANGVYKGFWDIVVKSDIVSNVENDIHLDKGMIYSVKPNPFKDKIEINYSVFKKDSIQVLIYDSNSNRIKTLVNETKMPNKYKVTWELDKQLSAGIYFVVLKVKGLQVSYKRIKKK